MTANHDTPSLAGKLHTRDRAADYILRTWGIRCSAKTLAKYATVGGGPKFRKAGRQPLYSEPDMDAWALAKISAPRNSSSEAA